MDSHSKKILITGINGFTGVYLSKYFEDNHFEVYGISNHADFNEKNIFKCNLLNEDNLNLIIKKIQPNIVIHLAAISFVGHKNVNEIYETNVIGTKNLLEAIKNEGIKSIKKVIIASSATVYGNQIENELNENLVPNPVNHYGISKLAMEFVVKMYFDILPIIITRPFNYTAPKQNKNFVIPKITDAFNSKLEVLELGNTNVFREYNSIEFICESYFLLSISVHQSTIVNLCSGTTHSLDEIIKICKKITNHDIKININENFVRKNEISKLSGSPSKLNQLVKLKSNNNIINTLQQFFK